jgi:hypothetical protein
MKTVNSPLEVKIVKLFAIWQLKSLKCMPLAVENAKFFVFGGKNCQKFASGSKIFSRGASRPIIRACRQLSLFEHPGVYFIKHLQIAVSISLVVSMETHVKSLAAANPLARFHGNDQLD